MFHTHYDGSVTVNNSARDALIAEQQSDKTLNGVMAIAKQNKGNLYFKNGLLYHKDQVLGQNVEQQCFPHGRRLEVCSLAHDMCHQGHLKTKEKIRHNFYWTDVAKTVKDYVDSCLACQKKTRAVVKDRVPISVIPRYEIGLPFSHLYLDVIGLLTELCRPNRFVYTVSICISVAVCHSKGRV